MNTTHRANESAPRRAREHGPIPILYAEASNAQLYRMARDRKILGRGVMSREDLIRALAEMDRHAHGIG